MHSSANAVQVTSSCTSSSIHSPSSDGSGPHHYLHHHFHHLPNLSHFQQLREQQKQQQQLQHQLAGVYPYQGRITGRHEGRQGRAFSGQFSLWDNGIDCGKMNQYDSNPVGALQERFQSRGIAPIYQVIHEEGASHCPTFSYQVQVSTYLATGSGNSKKQAKHNAARAMLDKLDGRVPAHEVQPLPMLDYSSATPMKQSNGTSSSAGNMVGQLQELCVHHHMALPEYFIKSEEGEPHKRSFTMTVKVGDMEASGSGASKKEAKRTAAQNMIAMINGRHNNAATLGTKYEPEAISDSKTTIKETLDGHGLSKASEKMSRSPAKSKLGMTALTPEHSNKIQQFYSELNDEAIRLLHSVKLVKSVNCIEVLEAFAKACNFEAIFVDVEDKTEDDEVQVILQLSSLPVAVVYGTGSVMEKARQMAARTALQYLRLMTTNSDKADMEEGENVSNKNNGNQPED